ncbi:RNA-binding protein 12B-like [Bombina bombina]|uniref:RNA-binding protein 12B-like n=1 Tax=Bombina bombina TaxID=8345 RepID=UPI00235B0450|nr:RNA-binding protein 12B-like [Bombina bombina]
MEAVVRLQGVSSESNSVDIRHFFSGLAIPKRGVYIIGGPLGEAFVKFATNEDALYAMKLTGHPLKNSFVYLTLSSIVELQNACEKVRKIAEESRNVMPRSISNTVVDCNGVQGYKISENQVSSSEGYNGDRYLYLQGITKFTKRPQIEKFFFGLLIDDVIIFDPPTGALRGNAIVKFAYSTDAREGLKLDQKRLSLYRVTVTKADKKEWTEACQKYRPVKNRRRSRSRSPVSQECYVYVTNLPHKINKSSIARFLNIPQMKDSQLSFLLNEFKERTRECFVLLNSTREKEKVLRFHKTTFVDRMVRVYAVSKKYILDKLSNNDKVFLENDLPGIKFEKLQTVKSKWVYLRNFPSDIKKLDIKNFFSTFSLNENDIFLLYDEDGVGLGEALVKFSSEDEAASAANRNRQLFQETEILLRCVSEQQVKVFGIAQEECMPENSETLSTPLGSAPNDIPGMKNDSTESPSVLCSAVSQLDNGTHSPQGIGVLNKSFEEKKGPVTMIHIGNLPFNFTVGQILELFHGYKVSSVHRVENGSATISMKTFEEAVSAYKKLSDTRIGQKTIVLSLIW